MRAQLLELATHRTFILEYEIGRTVDLCAEVVQSHWLTTHRPFEGPERDDHEYVESLSDQNFRTAYEVQFIWQLGLWRITALFEAILSQWFPDLRARSLKRKIDGLEAAGIVIPEHARAELALWINLRNTLSHRPPEAPSLAHQLEQGDLEEFAALASNVLALARARSNMGDRDCVTNAGQDGPDAKLR